MIYENIDDKEYENIKDYKKIRKIGEGAFGNIFICKNDKKYYAMKEISKSKLINSNIEYIKWHLNERNFLKEFNCKYIIKYIDSFQTLKYLYLITEYVPGGDLFTLLNKKRKLNEKECKFLACDILKGLYYLHDKDIIHGDFKLENILINLEGHIKICDFGFSHKKNNLNFNKRGTKTYMAPELFIDGYYYSEKIDIWAFGVILFELCIGYPPFVDEETNYLDILEILLSTKLKFPENSSDDFKDVLLKIFETDPEKRIDIYELKKHRWFDIDKDKKPFYIPYINDMLDTQHFDTYLYNINMNTKVISKKYQRYFINY